MEREREKDRKEEEDLVFFLFLPFLCIFLHREDDAGGAKDEGGG